MIENAPNPNLVGSPNMDCQSSEGACVCVCVCVCVEAGSNTLDHCDHQFRANFKAPVQLF